ncbi:MAG: membrane protein insertion efficiency factor YidD [Gammaproteobacteria bacterium]
MKTLLLLLVRGYRLAVSPLFPPRCRFLPSCSDYAVQAIERHGPWAGGWLALRRFARCHPLHPGGIDEVPERTHPPTR